jgi:hypothetical protein
MESSSEQRIELLKKKRRKILENEIKALEARKATLLRQIRSMNEYVDKKSFSGNGEQEGLRQKEAWNQVEKRVENLLLLMRKKSSIPKDNDYLAKLEKDHQRRQEKIKNIQEERREERKKRAERFRKIRERQRLQREGKDGGIDPDLEIELNEQPRWIRPVLRKILKHELFTQEIKHLFIFHKNTDVCLFYLPFTKEELEPQLIAGFFSAIVSFGGYLTQNANLKKLEYKGFKIAIVETQTCRYALIFDDSVKEDPSTLLEDFSETFEEKFKVYLEKFTGDISVFEEGA